MMKSITATSSLVTVAALVSEALKKYGIDAVLTGGAVVSIYSNNKYLSWDLDFIIEGLAKKVDHAMSELGFLRKHGRHYIHPQSKFFVEFPGGPLAIGDMLIDNISEKKTKDGCIRLLPPTECVMDRLAAFYFWNDLQCLEQALLVARCQFIHISQIEKWSRVENMLDKFGVFKKKLNHNLRY